MTKEKERRNGFPERDSERLETERERRRRTTQDFKSQMGEKGKEQWFSLQQDARCF